MQKKTVEINNIVATMIKIHIDFSIKSREKILQSSAKQQKKATLASTHTHCVHTVFLAYILNSVFVFLAFLLHMCLCIVGVRRLQFRNLLAAPGIVHLFVSHREPKYTAMVSGWLIIFILYYRVMSKT